jgi:transcriptional antiterminator NusG
MSEYFGEYLIPKVVKEENSKKSERKLMPGYIFLQMVLNEETWELVRKTPKISGFIGGYRNPPPVPEEEIQHLKEIQQKGADFRILNLNISEGDNVIINDGPFKDFSGSIIAIDQDKGKLTVEISIFGRQTPVIVDFTQITKK